MHTNYHGFDVYSGAPVSGGVQVVMMLNILEGFELARIGGNFSTNLEAAHWLVESMKFAYANRRLLGDPTFSPANMSRVVAAMSDKAHAAALRSRLSRDKTFEPPFYVDLTADLEPMIDFGTTHMTAVDADRNACAFTDTVMDSWCVRAFVSSCVRAFVRSCALLMVSSCSLCFLYLIHSHACQ